MASPLAPPSPLDPGQDPSLGQAISQGQQQGAALQARGDASVARIDAAASRADRKDSALQQMENEIPFPGPPQNIPPPQPKETSAMQQWGSAAMIFAGLASLLTRTPATTALNAGAAALNAFKKNDQAEADRQYKIWQEANKNAMEVHNYQMDVYKSIIDRIKGSESENDKQFNRDSAADKAEFQLTATAFHDNQLAEAMNVKGLGAVDTILEKRQAAADKMAEAGPKIEEGFAFHQAYNSWLQSDAGKRATPYQKYAYSVALADQMNPTYAKTEAVQKQKEQVAGQIATAIKSGAQPPTLTGLYGLSGQVRAALAKDGVDLTQYQLDWQRAQQQVKTLGGPQMTRFVALASSVDNTINEVKQLGQQLDQGGVPALNRLDLQAYVQTQGNSPKGQLATRYIVAVNTLKEEFANLANGGYAPHELAWALANEQINGNYGRDQLDSSLDEVKRLINYRVAAIPGLKSQGPGAPDRYEGTENLSGAAGDGTTNNPRAEGAGSEGDEIATPSGSSASSAPPKVGDTMDGYRFQGGDPSDQNNWTRVQ